ncbi:hypothetical protein [Streptomyces sp. NPDC058157]|uniref:hypothetical protein n=1 Tax=Streptomyces sp. NPDC058157 TaxID=3346360 RepID=UPI0036EAE15B
MAVHIQSLPEGAPVTIRALADRFPESGFRIGRALNELEQAGYLSRTRLRLPAGQVVTRTLAYNVPASATPTHPPDPPRATPPPEPTPNPAPDPAPVPLLGVPVYAVFDPRTGTGAVMSDIHQTPDGPRYATRRDFLYGEDVTIAQWTISTDGLPRYEEQ